MDSHFRGNGKHIVEQFMNTENASVNWERGRQREKMYM